MINALESKHEKKQLKDNWLKHTEARGGGVSGSSDNCTGKKEKRKSTINF